MGGWEDAAPRARLRNEPGQYDDLVGEWWEPDGTFAVLHWLAATRAGCVPPAARAGAVLVDVGCGGGLLAPHVAHLGYRHVGVDVTASALRQAASHGVVPAVASAMALPIADATADVVCAGQVLEHVTDLPRAVAELCRVLRPGGTLVVDTIARTTLARVLVVDIGERVPGGAPTGLHDPGLFVDPKALARECARHGVEVTIGGLRPAATGLLRWLARRAVGPMARSTHPGGRVVPTRSTAVLYSAVGVKGGGP